MSMARETSKQKKTEVQLVLETHLHELGIEFACEAPFSVDRNWRADYVLRSFPSSWRTTILEIEGGAFTKGRHTRGKGFLADMEKYNFAAMSGHFMLRFTPRQILDGTARAFLRKWKKT